MTKRYKVAVLIGRFEPTHNGHVRNFKHASEIADTVQILVGSTFQPRTIKNPFDFYERQNMIESVLGVQQKVNSPAKYNYIISALKDHTYSNNSWIREVQELVQNANPDALDSEIAILGHDKDESSWYNHAFPNWNFVPLNGFVEYGSHPIDATKIRELMFEGHIDFIKGAVPDSVFKYLVNFTTTNEYNSLVEEYKFIKDYKKAWLAAPYAPTFMTVDAVVIQGGHILLIQRGFAPGKGLWALPGGFLNQKETCEIACIRELIEETRLKVPEIVLRKAITYEKLFDNPDRSLRGRTITQAYLIELDGGDGALPKVKGSDDAKKAKWFTLAEVAQMGEVMFEDHAHIIDIMVARAKK